MTFPPLLPLLWILIIAFCIVMYVILDGFTLGTGMLLPFLQKEERDIAVSVVLPTWDGNQTWLVLGMASLYGAFPLAFSSLLPVLYLPLFTMVIALLFRGVSFEFRLKAQEKGQVKWDWVFCIASAVATLVQGLVLGNFVEGFVFRQRPFIISDKSFFTWFSLFTMLSLVFGYLLLGATRLIIKTEGSLQKKMYRAAFVFAIAIATAMLIVSIWTPFIDPKVFERWFGDHRWVYLAVLPLITGVAFLLLLRALYKKYEHMPYWCSICLFLCAYIGFGVSLYPYIVPYKITFWDAASPNSSLAFLIVGAVIMLPVLLIYTGYSYRIFKGKVKSVLHY